MNLVDKSNNGDLTNKDVGYYAYKLCLYYHPTSRLCGADDYYDIDRSMFDLYSDYIRKRIKYSREKTNITERLVLNEMKHLSSEFRTNADRMYYLLHPDFKEIGKSGTIYNRKDILDSIPLEIAEYIIEEFSYSIKNEIVENHFLLMKNDSKRMKCISKWKSDSDSVRLLFFESK